MAATGFSWLAYAETTTATSDGSEKANVQPSTAILSNDHGISLMKEASTEQTSASSSSSKNPDEVVSGNIVDIASSGADCSSSPLISRDLRATIELKRQKALALKRKREESEVSASRALPQCQSHLEDGSTCSSTSVDAELLQAFGESVCAACKAAHQVDYQVITKTEVAAGYLLSSDSISLMKFVERVNPKNTHWAPMKMYLQRHARIKAHSKWGGDEGLLAEKSRRDKARFLRQMEKSENIFGGENSLEHYLETSGAGEKLIEVNKVETKKSRAKAQKKKVDALLSVFSSDK